MKKTEKFMNENVYLGLDLGSMKDELGQKFISWIRSKNYSYLIDGGNEDKKEEDTKNCVIKRKLQFKNNKNCLKATKLEN